jgi:fluoride exporter
VPEPAAEVAVPGPAGASAPHGRARLVLPRADRREVAAIFAGGALGTLARAALAEAFPHSATAWPWPTFGVNIVAAFLVGYFVTRLQERLPLSSYRRPLLGTGLCGGLSTFSTMQVEILKMAGAGAAMSILIWVAVALIGGAGSLVRFLVDGTISSAAGRDFPFGTMAVNISGAMILGLLTGLALGSDETLLAGTAAVGSYTTFSTWMLETQRLTEERQYRKAVLNVVVSLVLGVAAAAAGRLIGAQL